MFGDEAPPTVTSVSENRAPSPASPPLIATVGPQAAARPSTSALPFTPSPSDSTNTAVRSGAASCRPISLPAKRELSESSRAYVASLTFVLAKPIAIAEIASSLSTWASMVVPVLQPIWIASGNCAARRAGAVDARIVSVGPNRKTRFGVRTGAASQACQSPVSVGRNA